MERVLRQYHASIKRFAQRHCAAEDIEDAVQETLWVVYRKIGYLKTAQAFISWTFQIVKHQCYRLLHRNQPSTVCDLTLELSGENQWGDEDLKQDVLKALASLPFTYRQVVILRDLEGYTGAETAKCLALHSTP